MTIERVTVPASAVPAADPDATAWIISFDTELRAKYGAAFQGLIVSAGELTALAAPATLDAAALAAAAAAHVTPAAVLTTITAELAARNQ